jgi:hypothetical protein
LPCNYREVSRRAGGAPAGTYPQRTAKALPHQQGRQLPRHVN